MKTFVQVWYAILCRSIYISCVFYMKINLFGVFKVFCNNFKTYAQTGIHRNKFEYDRGIYSNNMRSLQKSCKQIIINKKSDMSLHF